MTLPSPIPHRRRVVGFEEFGPPSVLVEQSQPLPALGADDVLIRVTAAGVNFADTMVRRGEYRRDQILPHVPGMEVAGTIAWAAPGGSLSVGMPVVGFMEHGGGYTDYAIQQRDRVFTVPADIDGVTVAAAFLQGVSAWYAVVRYGHVRAKDNVLVTAAAGGLGGLAVQLAADRGASVIGTASSPDKRSQARELGCVDALDVADPDFRSQVLELTGGRGVDVIIDGVGGPVFGAALACLAHSGRYVVVGSATQQPATLDVRHLMPRAQTVSGFIVRRVMELDANEPGRALSHVLDRISAGAIRVRTTSMALGDAAQAHRLIESRQSVGKICLVP